MIKQLLQIVFGEGFPLQGQKNKADKPERRKTPIKTGSVPSGKRNYDTEIEILKQKYGDLADRQISIELEELLSLVPRQRRRADAYVGLQGALKRFNCDLHITSRKTKNRKQYEKINYSRQQDRAC